MNQAHSDPQWFKLFIALWLASAIHLFGLPQTKTAHAQAESFLEVKLTQVENLCELTLETDESINLPPPDFLAIGWCCKPVPPSLVVFPPYNGWPDQSRLNSYQDLISYQYYKSALTSRS